MFKSTLIWKTLLILSFLSQGSLAQMQPQTPPSSKTETYGLIYRWVLPKTIKEQELVDDFKKIADLAAQQGASSSHLYRGSTPNEYIGIEFWPSKEQYSSWFDQKNFRFREPQSQEIVKLIKKIKDVYKNKLLIETTEQIL